MKTLTCTFQILFYLLLIVLGTVGTMPVALGQGAEQEPNNTCQTAQDFGQRLLPFVVAGNLDSSVSPDVDFYRFTATPGATVEVTLEGAATGKGTLGDPFLGRFDGNCNLVQYNNDYSNLNSRIVTTVPADGILVLAAQACCDFSFAGGGNGTYQLTINSLQTIGSISGQVVDATTQAPLQGFIDLYRCTTPTDPSSCVQEISSTYGDSGGRFRFSVDYEGQPLEVGSYQVVASVYGYPTRQVGPFDVGQGQNLDIGTIALNPPPSIGSISGQVIDAYTGIPLSGTDYPYTYVNLNRCDNGYCYSIKSLSVDGAGRFRFSNDYPGQLPPGNYEVIASAQEYQQGQVAALDVHDGENRNVGDIPLKPYPIRFSEIRPCGALPPEGGTCDYSVRVTNRSTAALKGAVWSLVSGDNIGSLANSTRFQTANPQKMTLAPGAYRVVNFQFIVPTTVKDGAFICANVSFGETSDQPFFNTLGQKGLFCITKGYTGFSLMPKKKSQDLFRQLDGPHYGTPPRK